MFVRNRHGEENYVRKTHFKIMLEISQNSDDSWLLAALQKLSKAKFFDAGVVWISRKKGACSLPDNNSLPAKKSSGNHRDRLTVVAKITRESTNYAALVLLKNKTHLNLLWIDKTLPKWKIHLAIKFEECLESVQNEILANVFRCHCNFNDID